MTGAFAQGLRTPWRSTPVEVIPCAEQGPVEIDTARLIGGNGQLDIDEGVLESGEYFTFTLRRGTLTLRALNYVGYIPLNRRTLIYVRPRVPVDSLESLAAHAGADARPLSIMRAYRDDQPWNGDLTELYAWGLVRHVEAIRGQGLLRAYERRQEITSTPHGRILADATIRRQQSRGTEHKATVSYFQRTVDTPANQCIKFAMWLIASELSRQPGGHGGRVKAHTALNASYATFDAVNLVADRSFLKDPIVSGRQPPPPARSAYRGALDLAVSLIQQRSVALGEDWGNIRLPAVVLNMADLFERLIRRGLQTVGEARGWPVRVLDGNIEGRKPLYGERNFPDATPDIVLRSPTGWTSAVVEVKYVPVKASGLSARRHVHQAVAYGLTYSTDEVLLVHPLRDGQEPGWHDLGHIGEVHLSQYRFDLSTGDVHSEWNRLADAVEGLGLLGCG